MINKILYRFLSPKVDVIEDVKQKSFLAFLLSQFIFTFYSLFMAFTYPESKSIYLMAASITIIQPLLFFPLIKKHFKIAVRVYAFINFVSAVGFLIAIRGSNATNAVIALVFLNLCVYAGLLIKYYWGFLIGVLTVLLYIVDFQIEQKYPEFGITSQLTSPGHFLLAVFCYFFIIIGFIFVYALLLKRSVISYKEELNLRIKVQGELEHLNNALLDMNKELRENNLEFEEINNRLSMYAYKNAHEVRAPLCRLKGLLNLYQKAKDEGEQAYILKEIRNSSDELYSIIGEMNKLLQKEEYIAGQYQ